MRAGIPGCHKELAMNLDVCLGDIKGLPNQERDLLIGYLKERSKDLQRPPLSYYEQAISNLENREGVQFQDLIYEEALKKAGKEGKMVFMDCNTVWCGPCKMVAPIIEELAAEFEGQVIIGKCDVDENGDMAAEYGIRNIPTVLFFKNGEIVDKQVGAVGKPVFAEKVKKLL